MQTSLWILQILILTVAIHVFLRFVRTTRGNPIIRGLLLSVLVGLVGLWGLATVLELEELEHIIEGSTGYVLIGLVIVFQPELRRAISQLGERSRSRGASDPNRDMVRDVVLAARSLADRREGALIAFEREVSLHTVVETGSSIGARVSPRLLQSLFHPGGALHDGAVVLRGNQVLAAGCILPLSKGKKLSAEKGTRHRAALGLSEETDALILVASEETGEISVAHAGKLQSNVAPDKLEALLLRLLGDPRGVRSRAARVPFALLRSAWNDLGWLTGSLLLASAAWFTAHQSIREVRPFLVNVVDSESTGRRNPREGEILIVSPGDGIRIHARAGEERVRILVSGSKGEFRDLGPGLRGVLEIEDESFRGGPLNLESVRWEEGLSGLSYRFEAPNPPELIVERSTRLRLQLRPTDLTIDSSHIDPRFAVRSEAIRFDPSPDIEVEGPTGIVSAFDHAPAFEPLVLGPSDRGEVRVRLAIAADLLETGVRFSSGSSPFAIVPVLPVERSLGTIRKEIALVSMIPEKAELLDRWRLPANSQTARLAVVTSGLIPADADPGSKAVLERTSAILRFVEDNLRIFVDVAELPEPGGGRSVPVRVTWMKRWQDWPEELELEAGTLGEWERLEVRLESEPQVLLDPVSPQEETRHP